MPLRRHKASIKFINGVQQKADHKILPSDNLVTLENGRFDKIGAINKRTGYTFIDKESSDLVGYKNTLVARNVSTGDRLGAGTANRGTSYSESSGNFIGDFSSGNKGYSDGIEYTSIPVSKGSEVQQQDSNVAFSSDGKYACITFVDAHWNTSGQNIAYDKRVSIVDRESNTLLAGDIKLGSATYSGNNGRRMVPVWTNDKFYIIGEDEGAIKMWIIDPTATTIVVTTNTGSVSAAGQEMLATANYPLIIGAAGDGYPTSQASFDACTSVDYDDRILIFLTHLTGSTYTVKFYYYYAGSHNFQERISKVVTGTTSNKGHMMIHRPSITGTHTAKVAFGYQNGTTFNISVATTENSTTADFDSTETFTVGGNDIVRGTFLDDINSLTGNANQDVALIYEESAVTQIHGAAGNSSVYITNDVFAGIPGTAELELSYKQRFTFAFGRGPFTLGTVHDDSASGVSGYYYPDPPINTIALWDLQRSAVIGASADTEYYQWVRDSLPIAMFKPLVFQTDRLKTAYYAGATSNLKGAAVAVPVGSHLGRFGVTGGAASFILNSIVRLFDFRRVNEELVDTPVPSTAVLHDILYVADKGLFQYDGSRFRSMGFADRPEFRIALGGDSGGNLVSSGVYNYKLVYEWTDAQGNLHESEPSAAATITAGAKQNVDVSPVQNNLPDFDANEIKVAIYRTQSGGSIYNHLTSVGLERSDGFTAWNDNMSDGTVASGKFLYTDSGEIANTPPPASARYVAVHRDRLFVIGKDDVIYFSKLVKDGFGVAFSEALSIKTPDNISDPPTALGSMDGNLFIFTENSIFIVGGEGPDNLGAGGFYDIKRIPTSVGAAKGSPVRLTDKGLIFISKKGTSSKIYMLARNMSVAYLGAPVEDILSPPGGTPYMVKDITVNPDQETVLFLLSQISGTPDGVRTVTYNYEVGQWGVDTVLDTYGAGAGGAFAWSGIGDDKKLYISLMKTVSTPRTYVTTTGFLDNDTYVPMKVKTGWINLAGIQSYQRIYNFHVLGESKDKHILTVNVYYDYNTTAVDSYTFTTSSATDAKLQFRGHLSKQKCQSIQFEIVDADNGGSGDDGYTITEIALDIGLKADGYKQNNAKLGSTSTIGSN